jgi:hypothetical protein
MLKNQKYRVFKYFISGSLIKYSELATAAVTPTRANYTIAFSASTFG